MNTKKRNPQDATLRNIRALKARVERLQLIIRGLAIEGLPLSLILNTPPLPRKGRRRR